MITLPNGITVFNATPHVIRFWDESWEEPIEVKSDGVLSATPRERMVQKEDRFSLVTTEFDTHQKGVELVIDAIESGADMVIGSIIAAQAYDNVVAMVPCDGYERVPPAEKRMRPDKFNIYRQLPKQSVDEVMQDHENYVRECLGLRTR